MTERVFSEFTIASNTLDSAYLSHHFSWPVTEAVTPNDKVNYNITTFDLGVGQHTRVADHLHAAKQALLKKETELIALSCDCHYALWVKYRFPKGEGGFNLSESLLAAFGFLRVEIIFDLQEE